MYSCTCNHTVQNMTSRSLRRDLTSLSCGALRGYPALCEVLSAHASDPILVIKLCSSISSEETSGDGARVAFMEANMLDPIMKALQFHTNNAAVTSHLIRVIAMLAEGEADDLTKCHAAKRGAIIARACIGILKAITAALRICMADNITVRYTSLLVCSVLRSYDCGCLGNEGILRKIHDSVVAHLLSHIIILQQARICFESHLRSTTVCCLLLSMHDPTLESSDTSNEERFDSMMIAFSAVYSKYLPSRRVCIIRGCCAVLMSARTQSNYNKCIERSVISSLLDFKDCREMERDICVSLGSFVVGCSSQSLAPLAHRIQNFFVNLVRNDYSKVETVQLSLRGLESLSQKIDENAQSNNYVLSISVVANACRLNSSFGEICLVSCRLIHIFLESWVVPRINIYWSSGILNTVTELLHLILSGHSQCRQIVVAGIMVAENISARGASGVRSCIAAGIASDIIALMSLNIDDEGISGWAVAFLHNINDFNSAAFREKAHDVSAQALQRHPKIKSPLQLSGS